MSLLPVWNVETNYNLGIINERETVLISLPITTSTDLSTEVISGSLPGGLRLEGNNIVGTPFEVARDTQSRFVIRATNSFGKRDRTFSLTVIGPDNPNWVTPEGRLGVGPNNVLFILDSSIIDYQLEASDTDLPAGEILEYYIADGDGELPPGITLTTDGKLQGVVDPLLALDVNVVDDGYDTTDFSKYPFDFNVRSDNGWDSYFYDITTYDYSSPVRTPRKLNRYYEFFVTVADNVTSVRRRFVIYVVGDDYVRADNTLMQAADGVFTADATFRRIPVWLTPADLGRRRAQNYQTFYLEILEQNFVEGFVRYALEGVNDDGSDSELPPGMALDETTGEIAGVVPYQPAVTKEYKFTVNAIRFTTDLDVVTVFATVAQDTLIGNKTLRVGKLPTGTADGIEDLNSLVGQTIQLNGRSYKIESVDGTNNDYDEITFESGLLSLRTVNPIVLRSTSTGGKNYLWINQLSSNDTAFYKNKTINFTDASHVIREVVDYIEWDVDTSDSTSAMQLVTDVTGTIDGSSDIEQGLEAYFSRTNAPATIQTEVSGYGITKVKLIIPSTAESRNKNFIESLFHTTDSDTVTATQIAQYQRVQLDSNLKNTLSEGRHITFAAVVKDSFSKTFNSADNETLEKAKTFTVSILGDVESTITWKTPADLGTLKANRISTLKVEAETTIPDAVLKYNLVSGSLPPGLALKNDGNIIGEVPIFGTPERKGLTFFDTGTTTFDGGTTTNDRSYTFEILARDRFGFSATSRTFTLKIDDVDQLFYSNLYFQPFLKSTQRSVWNEFIGNTKVFEPDKIYRQSDANFGVPQQLRSLAYAGIQTQSIDDFYIAVAKNHTRRKYWFGDVKNAVAKVPGTNNVVYEVVYVELVDKALPKSGNTRQVFNTINNGSKITVDSIKLESAQDSTGRLDEPFRFRPNGQTVTADTDAIQISQSGHSRFYISNIHNMRDKISGLGATSLDFLPLWMRTAQGTSLSELGYVLCVPLAYTLPGESTRILQNVENHIKTTEFDFDQIEYDIDRYIADAVTGSSQETFILFGDYKHNIA